MATAIAACDAPHPADSSAEGAGADVYAVTLAVTSQSDLPNCTADLAGTTGPRSVDAVGAAAFLDSFALMARLGAPVAHAYARKGMP